MRRIRNVAFVFLVLASMVRFGGTGLRADYYFGTCEYKHFFTYAAEGEHCESSCYSLGYDCGSFCGSPSCNAWNWSGNCAYVSSFQCNSLEGWQDFYCQCDW
jgi:hypothetical protein